MWIAMTSYNLQKGFNWALQAGGQGFESPQIHHRFRYEKGPDKESGSRCKECHSQPQINKETSIEGE
jgi:hypothetical protein